MAAAVAATAPPAEAACGGVQHFSPSKLRRPGRPPLAVGDSVMLGAARQLARKGFEVDVRGCRQMSEGLTLIASRRLPDVVVIGLGTNWTVTTSQIRTALRILGPNRVLGLITPPEVGGAASSDQTVIRAAGRRWRLRVKVLDWVAYSSGQSWSWDGMHLRPEGAVAYARLLSRAFTWPIPSLAMTVAKRAPREPPDRLSSPVAGAA